MRFYFNANHKYLTRTQEIINFSILKLLQVHCSVMRVFSARYSLVPYCVEFDHFLNSPQIGNVCSLGV